MEHLSNAGAILIEAIFGWVLIPLFLFRILLQAVRANFYNPICQFFYRTTNPVLMPLRKALPPMGRWDTAGLTVAWLLACMKTWLGVAVYGHSLPFFSTLLLGFVALADLTIQVYLVLIFVRVILSFIGPSAYHPILPLIGQLTEPLLAPLRRLLPATGAIDLSPMLLLLALYLLRALLIAPLTELGAQLAR